MFSLLSTAATKAGEVLLKYFHQKNSLTITQKTFPNNIVTQADLEAQQIIKTTITNLAPLHGILASELGFIGEEALQQHSTYTFIIDPVDGTSNFAAGYDYFSVSIACFKDGQPLAAVTYQPTTGLIYYGERNKGSVVMNPAHFYPGQGTPLALKPVFVSESFLAFHLPSHPERRQRMLSQLDPLLNQVRATRILGSMCLSLAQLGQNITNIVMYNNAGLWDIAAASLIVTEAGGVMTDWSGNPLQFDLTRHDQTYQVIGCHPKVLSEVMKLLHPDMSGTSK